MRQPESYLDGLLGSETVEEWPGLAVDLRHVISRFGSFTAVKSMKLQVGYIEFVHRVRCLLRSNQKCYGAV